MRFNTPTTFLNKPLNCIFGLLFLTVVFTFISRDAKAQFVYTIDGVAKKSGKKLEGAIITLYKGSTQVQQVTTTSNGKFFFSLEPNADYTVSITKGGHINKKLLYSTRGIPPDKAAKFEAGSKPEIEIFEMPKDQSVVSQINSILSQPVGKLLYDATKDDIVSDEGYAQSMQAALGRLQKIQDDADQKAEEDAIKAAEDAKKNAAMESAAASKYQAAIAKGDAAFGKKDYVTARTAYTDALDIKPGEAYPKGKIVEIEKLLADAAKNAALEADYKAAIAKGDAALASKNYVPAKAAYNDALKLKPTEAYPKNKLAEIDKLMADATKNAELNAKYDAAIAKADKALAAKTYDAAKSGYNEALGLKPAEKYPKDKLAEIDKLLAELANKDKAEKELQAKYDAAIAKADKALTAKTYDAAKAGYNEALGFKPAEAYPKTKLAEIDKLLGDLAAKDKANKELNDKYNAAIAKADAALKAKTYDAAKAGYNEALGLKAAEQYPKDKIAEIDKIIAELANKDKAEKDKLAKEKELNDKYNAALAKGDKALAAKTYDAAKAGYNEALGLKPAEKYPKDKLAEIDKLLADANAEKDKLAKAAELEAKYKAAIAKGDAGLKAKIYDAAKAGYNEALGFKPAEQYPKDKIAEIDALIAKELGAKALDEKYNAAVAKADKALAAKTYDAAKTGYNEALGFKPAEAYPKTKLAEIDKLLADLANKDKAEKDRLAKEKELEEKYKAAIAKADAALGTKEYAGAKTSYNEALGLKPAEKYPKDKIAEIDAILAKEMGAKALEEKYKAAIAKGDAALSKKDYTTAKTGYTDAVGLKPGEQYPKDKLAEIDKALANANAEKDKLAKAAELEAKYKAAIAKGDAGLKAKTYDAAKTSYTEALGFKPAEQYPKDKIAEIDALLAKEMGAKELDEKYKAAIAKADASFKAKTYDAAKAGYNEALGFKPAEAYPKTKLAEIDKLLADAAAKDAGDKDRLAKEKVLAEKYAAAIAKADAALGTKEYTSAKASYNEALGFKPAEKYPKDKIAEIDALLAKEMGAKALEEKYKAAIAKADASMNTKVYTAAKAAYNEALGFKPAEKYPKDKIAEIDAILAKELGAKAAEEKYKAAIAKADKAFAVKTYDAAKAGYNEALGFKPAEQYPKDKIDEINKLLAELSGKDAAERDRLAKELEAKYKAAIVKADAAFGGKDYTTAKTSYTEAISLKSSEQYPKDQLARVEIIIADEAKNKGAQARYDAAIAKADGAFTSKDYPSALAAYKEAQSAKPTEPYPVTKISEVNRLMDDLARAKGKEQQYKDMIAKADKFFTVKDYKQARNTYQDALLMKSSEKYPKDKIAEIDAMSKKTTTTVVAQTNKDDFRNELVKKYPEGITEESATENNAKVVRRIVVRGSEGHLYIQKTTSFGPIYYFKDGVPITEKEYMRDTEVVNK